MVIILNEPVEADLIIIGGNHQRSSRGQHTVYVPQQPPNKFQTATVDSPPAQLVSHRPELVELSHRGEPAPLHAGRLCHQLRSASLGGGGFRYPQSATWFIFTCNQVKKALNGTVKCIFQPKAFTCLTFPPQVLPRWTGPRDREERADVVVQ